MRIAIVGSGVSGLVAAHLLNEKHEIAVFEASERIGGHVNTVTHTDDRDEWSIDTGFIVYNENNYPLFTKILSRLGVASQDTEMSFSVRCDRTGLEYNGSTLRQLFVQKRNLLRPGFLRMIKDVLRFNREAPEAVSRGAGVLPLGEYLAGAAYSSRLSEHYLIPMGSALWSIPRQRVLEMPTEFFVRFFGNHGMLTVDDRPRWRVVQGGSDRYVEKLVRSFANNIRTSTAVKSVVRHPDHVCVNGEEFDHVVLACHSDQALAVLEDPSSAEREVLGALPYQKNHVVLHTDETVLPSRKRAWGAWNYHIRRAEDAPVTVTYNMNILQRLDSPKTFCVTLNPPSSINSEKVLYETEYSHPLYTIEGMKARSRFKEISGLERTHYCGAYWGFGFHEDGVSSATRVAEQFGVAL